MIRAVIFDMDGLLIDSEIFWQEEERRIFSKLGVPVTEELQRDTYGLGTYEVVKHWYSFKPWGDKNFDAIVAELYDTVARRIVSHGAQKNGVKFILDYFASKELPLAVASSSPMRIINPAIDKLGIRNYFKVIHSCEFEEFEKPHPAVYIAAAKKLACAPSECLVFEDSVIGMIAAKSARMKVCCIPDPKHYSDLRYHVADLKLNSLNEFNEVYFNQINGLN